MEKENVIVVAYYYNGFRSQLWQIFKIQMWHMQF